MNSLRAFFGAALAAALMFSAGPMRAQEISPSHLAAALDVIITTKTAQNFDDVLPALSLQVQDQLIRLRPDLHREITSAVEKVALELAGRRSELNNDIARIWAQAFTEEELVAIAAFYRSPAGIKLADAGASVLSQSVQAAQSWSERLGEELLEKARAELTQQGVTF